MDLSRIKKILVVKLCCIGDVMFTTPLVKALRNGFPEAEITYLVGQWSREVIETNHHLNRVILFDVPLEPGSRLKKMRATVKFLKKLKEEKFDLTINCHRSLSSNLLLFLAGIKYRVGFHWHYNSCLLNKKVSFDYTKHEVERYLDIAREIGLVPQDIHLEIGLKEEEREKAKNIMEEINPQNQPCVVFFPGGGKNPRTLMFSKRWLPERYAQLGDWVREKYNALVVFLGGEDDREVIEKISTLMRSKAISLAGKLSFRESTAIIEKSHLFVGGDSGLLYLAAAVETPTIALFGPSNPRLVAPLGEKHSYLWKEVECSPCYVPETVHQRKFLKCDDFRCMEAISLEEVKEAVSRQWKRWIAS